MSLPRRTRTVLDVSKLPDIAFGPADIVWWGTLGFVVIEGFTLVLCAAVYLYLTQNFATWPPQGTPRRTRRCSMRSRWPSALQADRPRFPASRVANPT